MTSRRTSLWLVLLVVASAAGAGCASSGSGAGTGGVMSGLDDCENLYPPVTSGYGYPYSSSYGTYGSAFYDDGLCSAYPRLDGNYYPEYVVQSDTSRQVTSANSRDHHGTVVTRGEPQGWGSRSGNWSSDSSSSGSSGWSSSGSVPRMEPIPVNSPSPSSGSPGPGTATVQPREH